MHSDPALVDRAVAAAKAGDASALHCLFLRYADELLAYTTGIVRGAHEAEDVLKALFLALPAKLDGYDPGELPFKGWLIGLAREAALDHLRARGQVPGPQRRRRRGRRRRAADESGERPRVAARRHVFALSDVLFATRSSTEPGTAERFYHFP